MRLFLLASVAFTVSAGVAGAAGAAPIWTVSSAATAAYAELFADNGTVVRQVSLGGDIDPRGIAVVGNTGYVSGMIAGTTNLTSGVIRPFNVTTGAVSKDVATSPLFGALAFDGAGFWAADNGGLNKAFHTSFSGVKDATITLSKCDANCSGLEYYQPALTLTCHCEPHVRRGNPGAASTVLPGVWCAKPQRLSAVAKCPPVKVNTWWYTSPATARPT